MRWEEVFKHSVFLKAMLFLTLSYWQLW